VSKSATGHDLLFGLLALQNGLIEQDQLMNAFRAWTLDRSRSLGDHLEALGNLSPAKRALLEALAAVHLETHGGDVEAPRGARLGPPGHRRRQEAGGIESRTHPVSCTAGLRPHGGREGRREAWPSSRSGWLPARGDCDQSSDPSARPLHH